MKLDGMTAVKLVVMALVAFVLIGMMIQTIEGGFGI